ncbi:5' nucleotidase, deoxy (Pyrimidine), cytosolic type C protein (NT5C) [compost metagenome]
MTKLKIGVDIDGTVINTSTLGWYKYLEARYELNGNIYYKMPYNVSEMFIIPEGCDPFAYWKDPNLYEGLQPIEGAVEYLQLLKEKGHEIIFISQAKGWHQRSKYYFIDKWFPFKDGVILTKEKWLVDLDIMIDDSYAVLDKMNCHTIKFRDDTEQPLSQKPHDIMMSWQGIYEYLNYGV